MSEPFPNHKFRWALTMTVTVLVIAFGTLGYIFIEGWPFLDALYMTLITMTTIGYGEVHALSEYGRLFTMALIVVSIGIGGYVFSTVAAFIIEGEIQNIFRGRRMDKEISKLKDHVIVCGLGRIGLRIAEEFNRVNTPFVVIEHDEKAIEEMTQQENMLCLKGDATRDDTLIRAGIKQAYGLITALPEDKDNVFVTLCARSLNPKLFIIARVSEDKNEDLLKKAGADRIVSPDAIGGIRMASIVLRPKVVAFFDEMYRVTGQTLRVEEIHIDEFPALKNRSLGEVDIRKRTGALVLAIKSADEGYQFNPGARAMLREGDVLIIVGTDEQIAPQRWQAEYCAS